VLFLQEQKAKSLDSRLRGNDDQEKTAGFQLPLERRAKAKLNSAFAGMTSVSKDWIPAFAIMTSKRKGWIPAFARGRAKEKARFPLSRE
jgi:hypothetical protein